VVEFETPSTSFVKMTSKVLIGLPIQASPEKQLVRLQRLNSSTTAQYGSQGPSPFLENRLEYRAAAGLTSIDDTHRTFSGDWRVQIADHHGENVKSRNKVVDRTENPLERQSKITGQLT
jgi:hypothetical protein